jgi:hypothetical protein
MYRWCVLHSLKEMNGTLDLGDVNWKIETVQNGDRKNKKAKS